MWITLREWKQIGIYLFSEVFLRDGALFQRAQQRYAEQEAHGGLADADRQRVVGEQPRERGGEARAFPREHRADDYGVADDRRHGGGPCAAAAARPHGGEQRGERADDQIEQAVRTEQVGDQAAHGKTGDRRLAVAAGQHAQSLAQAELDRGKGEAEEIGDPRERRVGGGNDGGAGEIAGRVLQLHRGVSFLGNVNRCGGKTVRRPRRTA